MRCSRAKPSSANAAPGTSRSANSINLSLIHIYTDVPKLHQVSFDRPYSGDGLGYYNTWERHFVAWAEGAGYPLAHATTYDLSLIHIFPVQAGMTPLSRLAGLT